MDACSPEEEVLGWSVNIFRLTIMVTEWHRFYAPCRRLAEEFTCRREEVYVRKMFDLKIVAKLALPPPPENPGDGGCEEW
jgi:hypothetical protein